MTGSDEAVARHQRLMSLFDDACELDEPGQRTFIGRLSQEDLSLAPELARMLRLDRRSEVFFDVARGAEVLAGDIADSGLARHGLADPQAIPERVGEYQILERIGAGSMGTVYRARQETPRRDVALKVLHPFLIGPGARNRFRFEAQLLARLEHPGIPRIHTVGEDGGLFYFAMDLVRGRPLKEHLDATNAPPAARVALVARIAKIVHHAHLRGVVHRDLKSENILVTEEGEPRVLDFGIAAALGGMSLITTRAPGELGGTLATMAPEQLDPSARIDGRADVFALGVLLYELLEGRPARALAGLGLEEAVRALRETDVPRLANGPPSVAEVVAKATARDVADRYPSAEALAHALDPEIPDPGPPPPNGAPTRGVRASRRAVIVVALLAALLSVVATALLLVGQLRARERDEAHDRDARISAADRAVHERTRARAAALRRLTIAGRDARPPTPSWPLLEARLALIEGDATRAAEIAREVLARGDDATSRDQVEAHLVLADALLESTDRDREAGAHAQLALDGSRALGPTGALLAREARDLIERATIAR